MKEPRSTAQYIWLITELKDETCILERQAKNMLCSGNVCKRIYGLPTFWETSSSWEI